MGCRAIIKEIEIRTNGYEKAENIPCRQCSAGSLPAFTVITRVRFAGGWGFNPPNDFLTPRVSVDLSSWGLILTPVLVLHVSGCGASTLSPVGDPPPQCFFYKSDTGDNCRYPTTASCHFIDFHNFLLLRCTLLVQRCRC